MDDNNSPSASAQATISRGTLPKTNNAGNLDVLKGKMNRSQLRVSEDKRHKHEKQFVLAIKTICIAIYNCCGSVLLARSTAHEHNYI